MIYPVKSNFLSIYSNVLEKKEFKKENVNINGVVGIRLTIEDPENPSAISTIVLLKAGNNVFKFSYARNSAKSAIVMDQMLQNFELK